MNFEFCVALDLSVSCFALGLALLYYHSAPTMNFLPNTTPSSSIRNTDLAPSAPSAPALTDTLRAQGPVNVVNAINNRHPIEARILNWDATQQKMKMETHRRLLGAADPIKREMDASMVSQSEFRPTLLGLNGSASLHSDILQNKDVSLDWEDVYPQHHPSTLYNDIHSTMEARLNI